MSDSTSKPTHSNPAVDSPFTIRGNRLDTLGGNRLSVNVNADHKSNSNGMGQQSQQQVMLGVPFTARSSITFVGQNLGQYRRADNLRDQMRLEFTPLTMDQHTHQAEH